MRSYLVTVHSTFVKVADYAPHANKSPDYVALVDGDRQQYFIQKGEHLEKRAKWRDRGVNHLFYHAQNSGNRVQWIPSGRKLRTGKKKQLEKQLELF